MIVLADNDVLFKLDLFEEFLTAFQITYADIQILKFGRYSMTSNRHRSRIGEESFSRLLACLAKVNDLSNEPNAEYVNALELQTDKNVDAGEMALFAVCPIIVNSSIVTGDKRSLSGLTEAGATDDVCAKLCLELAGRVFCFEQVLEKIIDRFGFDTVRERLVRGRECDRGLAQCLGHDCDATEVSFREGLKSYLNDARRTSGSLLAP